MNLASIPLLIIALVLASSQPGVETVEIVMSGQRHVIESDGALIVGESVATIPPGARIRGPIYVVGGELHVVGEVSGDITQLAGTVRVEDGAVVTGLIQHIGGTIAVAETADVGRMSSLDPTQAASDGPGLGAIPQILLAALLAGCGYLLGRKKRHAMANVSEALRAHPVATFTVGALVSITAISLFVFMAFTLVLVPVTVLGLLVGALTLGYALIGWGHLIGRRLAPASPSGRDTALGVLVVFGFIALIGRVPVIGDLMVFGLALSGIGAVVVTYYGVAAFTPEALSE